MAEFVPSGAPCSNNSSDFPIFSVGSAPNEFAAWEQKILGSVAVLVRLGEPQDQEFALDLPHSVPLQIPSGISGDQEFANDLPRTAALQIAPQMNDRGFQSRRYGPIVLGMLLAACAALTPIAFVILHWPIGRAESPVAARVTGSAVAGVAQAERLGRAESPVAKEPSKPPQPGPNW